MVVDGGTATNGLTRLSRSKPLDSLSLSLSLVGEREWLDPRQQISPAPLLQITLQVFLIDIQETTFSKRLKTRKHFVLTQIVFIY